MARSKPVAFDEPKPRGGWGSRFTWMLAGALFGLAAAEAWLFLNPVSYTARAKLFTTAELTGSLPRASGDIEVLLDDADFAETLIGRAELVSAPGFGASPNPLRSFAIDTIKASGLEMHLDVDLHRIIAGTDVEASSPYERARSQLDAALRLEASPTSSVQVLIAEAAAPDLAARLANTAAALVIEQASISLPPIITEPPERTEPQAVVVDLPDPEPSGVPAPSGEDNSDIQELTAAEADLVMRRQRLTQAETAVDDFLARTGAPSAELLGARQMRLEALRSEAAAQSDERGRLAARVRTLQGLRQSGGDLASAPEIVSAGAMATIRGELLAARQRVGALSETLVGQHPRLLDAREELATIEVRFNAQAAQVIDALRADLGAANRRIEQAEREAADLAATVTASQQAFTELRRLDRAVSEAQRDYEAVAAEVDALRTATAIASARQAPRAPQRGSQQVIVNLPAPTPPVAAAPAQEVVAYQLLEPAVPPTKPDQISPTTVRLGGAGGGAFLALFFVGLAGLRSDRLTSIKEVEEATALPVLAVVPALTKAKGKQRRKGWFGKRLKAPSQTPSERLNTIVQVTDALRVGSPDASSISLALFSTAEPATRATLTVDLAIAAAADGVEVAVIDCDSRSQIASNMLGAQRAGDVTALILGRGDTDAPSGETTVSGLFLFSLGSLASLTLKRLRREMIEAALSAKMSKPGLFLYDVPRPDRNPSARAIARVAETCVIVVEADKIERQELGSLIYHLHKAGADISGIVIVTA